MMRTIAVPVIVVLAFSAFPAAQSQSPGTIEGTVTDNSVSALPGVTVVVAGPVPIGGARTNVTDASGRYRGHRVGPVPALRSDHRSGRSEARRAHAPPVGAGAHGCDANDCAVLH